MLIYIQTHKNSDICEKSDVYELQKSHWDLWCTLIQGTTYIDWGQGTQLADLNGP